MTRRAPLVAGGAALAFVLALGSILFPGSAAAEEWHEAYRSGVTALTRGDPARAVGAALAVGERNLQEWRLKLSLILRVTDTDKLRRTLHKIFG